MEFMLMDLLILRVLTERLPLLMPSRMLWSQVLVLSQPELDQLLAVPETDSEEALLIYADDLLLTVALSTMD